MGFTGLPSAIRHAAAYSFGIDFGAVKLTMGSELAQQAEVPAATENGHIHVAQSSADLGSPFTRFMLGHELAHVVQQRTADFASFGSPVARFRSPTLEAEANRAATCFSRGQPVGPIVGKAPAGPMFQAFESGEHQRIGDDATNSKLIDLGGGYSLTYGEIVAMVGDYFEDLDQMKDLAKTPLGQQQLEYVRDVRVHGNVAEIWRYHFQAVQEADARYTALLPRNFIHFANPRESDLHAAPRDKDRDTLSLHKPRSGVQGYRSYHEGAIADAWLAATGNGSMNDAYANEAAGGHFLTDAFSAGHIRTPREDVKQYWEKKWKELGYEDPLVLFMEWAARQAFPGSELLQRRVIDELSAAAAGMSFSFGDLLSITLHDYDNKYGLDVLVAGTQYRVYGDGYLSFGDTRQLVDLAVREGIVEVDRAFQLAQRGLSFAQILEDLKGNDGLYIAEQFMPEAVDNRPPFDWKSDLSTLLNDAKFQVGVESATGKMVSEFRNLAGGNELAERFLVPLEQYPAQALGEMFGVKVDYPDEYYDWDIDEREGPDEDAPGL